MKSLTPWTDQDRHLWFTQQVVQRSYRDEVVTKIDRFRSEFEVSQYGALSLDRERYPLFIILSKEMNRAKKTVLITGGVHGYETSGVQGALEFMKSEANIFSNDFNFVCIPCVSPWGYETVNRWNSKAIDPNRSFIAGSEAEECALLLAALTPWLDQIAVHFDLHETTDTDNTVFRPALEKRDGVTHEFSEIPDGFYTVGDTENPSLDFQNAVIASVKKVTHIAEPDESGKIIGVTLASEGVILYPIKKLALCAGVSNAKFATTTEVYPDSSRTTPEICIAAQIAAIRGGLGFVASMPFGV
jgi:hypothetical protein